MRDCNNILLFLAIMVISFINNTFAQNPIIQNQFTADPSARVFGDSVYLYPSHDILGKRRSRTCWLVLHGRLSRFFLGKPHRLD